VSNPATPPDPYHHPPGSDIRASSVPTVHRHCPCSTPQTKITNIQSTYINMIVVKYMALRVPLVQLGADGALARRAARRGLTLPGRLANLICMTTEPEGADQLHVGTEPASAVLAASGITVTAAGKARWRQALSQPIPQHALVEGRRMRERAKARARGDAA
jgi:hypothetical protein